jgi:hypothetical protein
VFDAYLQQRRHVPKRIVSHFRPSAATVYENDEQEARTATWRCKREARAPPNPAHARIHKRSNEALSLPCDTYARSCPVGRRRERDALRDKPASPLSCTPWIRTSPTTATH